MKRKASLLICAVSLIVLGGLLWPVTSRGAAGAAPADDVVVHVLYFYSVDCEHCKAVEEEVLAPMEAQYGAQLDVRMLEIGTPANYELLIRAEERFGVAAADRGLPTLVIGDAILIGEDATRAVRRHRSGRRTFTRSDARRAAGRRRTSATSARSFPNSRSRSLTSTTTLRWRIGWRRA